MLESDRPADGAAPFNNRDRETPMGDVDTGLLSVRLTSLTRARGPPGKDVAMPKKFPP
jgi:hypothetical protein